ncbi:hypothetical protein [Streptomyces sp. SA15]|uniref:hypothetical protein n=1 Tax=Streptomyces sp. SA15 TaxID=934019 RepID=UPI00117C8F1A|nr:hypothetical protein [Streptomyces sp. SA15]
MKRSATVIGSAFLATVLATGTSFAAGGYTARNVSGGPPAGAACATGGWAEGCFVKEGDEIWVRDTRADSYHAAVHWWLTGGSASDDRVCHDHAGKAAGWTVCDGLSGVIAENKNITIWPMTMDGDQIVPNGASPQTIAPTS